MSHPAWPHHGAVSVVRTALGSPTAALPSAALPPSPPSPSPTATAPGVVEWRGSAAAVQRLAQAAVAEAAGPHLPLALDASRRLRVATQRRLSGAGEGGGGSPPGTARQWGGLEPDGTDSTFPGTGAFAAAYVFHTLGTQATTGHGGWARRSMIVLITARVLDCMLPVVGWGNQDGRQGAGRPSRPTWCGFALGRLNGGHVPLLHKPLPAALLRALSPLSVR